MKKLNLMIATALASVAVLFGVAFSPVTAFAEESAETPEIFVERVTDEEVVEGTESVENSAIETPSESVEKTEITFEDILSITGELMKQAGYGNEWEKAMYYIETAASAKKVDLSIFLVAGVLVFLIVDRTVKIIRWYRTKKSDTTSKDLNDIKTASGQQTTAINDLIDEEEKLVGEVQTNTESVKDNTEREKALAKGMEKQNVAIRCLIRGAQIKQDFKDEALRALNESDELCDKAIK